MKKKKIEIVLAILFILFPKIIVAQTYLGDVKNIGINIYQNFLSPVKSPISQCQYEPSCSNFASSAISEYGIVVGSALTADRWMRCAGDETKSNLYPKHGRKIIDPAINNYLFGIGNLWRSGLVVSILTPMRDTLDKRVKSFPEFLYDNGEFKNSILELLREKYKYQGDSIKEKQFDLLIALNYIRLNDLKSALNSVDYRFQFKDSNMNYYKFNIYYLINDFSGANLFNVELCKVNSDLSGKYGETAKKLIIYSLLKEDDFEAAKSVIRNYKGGFPKEKLERWDLLIEKSKDYKVKSPFLAGLMSAVLPGSGYVYSGSLKEGLSAFSVNALMGWGIYSLFKNKNTGSGILTSMVAAPFYFGNILGSANLAALQNNRSKESYLIQFRNEFEVNTCFSVDELHKVWSYIK